MTVILRGVAGSTAHGLAREGSDVDLYGVYVLPTDEILGVRGYQESRVTHVPQDETQHEVGKYVRLALAANPTVLELLYLTEYQEQTEHGRLLVEARSKFLSNRVRQTYGGYAWSQAERLQKRGNSFASTLKHRYAKHARHCFRLLRQGADLLQTGTLTVKVDEPDFYHEVGQLPPEALVPLFAAEYERFKSVPSVLPDQPDTDAINNLLLEIRHAFL
jgi:hypothetical protein